jgi:hypothetical protein
MKTIMNISVPKQMKDIVPFLSLTEVSFQFNDRKDTYSFIKKTTWNLYYLKRSKSEKTQILKYLSLVTGYSQIQTKRLVSLAIKGRLQFSMKTRNTTSFARKYTDEDIKLIADFDETAKDRNGHAMRKHFRRQFEIYGDERFKRLSNISNGQIYNLRDTNLYRYHHKKFIVTNPVSNHIGSRRKPTPEGQPGFIRVDTVHQGDRDDKKGPYYVNFVDEVTQWQIVICVPQIDEKHLKPMYEKILDQFPFKVINFHSDNGSEFLNDYVSKILRDKHIEQTKSRPRKHNDNGLVESKNGWVIRKEFGFIFRPKEAAPEIQKYLDEYFNTYLNYHRICAFPTKMIDKRGRERTVYKAEDYATPFEKLKEIDPKAGYMRSGESYEKMDKIQMEKSDYEYIIDMRDAYHKMIRKIQNIASPV